MKEYYYFFAFTSTFIYFQLYLNTVKNIIFFIHSLPVDLLMYSFYVKCISIEYFSLFVSHIKNMEMLRSESIWRSLIQGPDRKSSPTDTISGINSVWGLERVTAVSILSVAVTWPFWLSSSCLSPDSSRRLCLASLLASRAGGCRVNSFIGGLGAFCHTCMLLEPVWVLWSIPPADPVLTGYQKINK